MKGTWTQTVHVFSLLIYFLNHLTSLCLTNLGMWAGRTLLLEEALGLPGEHSRIMGVWGTEKPSPPDPVSSFSQSPAAPLSDLLANPGPPLFLLKTPRKDSSSA